MTTEPCPTCGDQCIMISEVPVYDCDDHGPFVPPEVVAHYKRRSVYVPSEETMQDRDEKAREIEEMWRAVVDPDFAREIEVKEARDRYLDAHPERRTVYDGPDPDLRAAKERLGAWLAAEPERSWSRETHDSGPGPDDDACVEIWLSRVGDDQTDPDSAHDIYADGPTEAAAILAALEKANGGA